MAIKSIVRKITEFELYAFMPAPRLAKRTRHGSLAGLLVSVVVLGIGIAYAVFAINRLLFSEKATIVITQTTLATASPMMPFQIELPYINDPSYFTYSVVLRKADDKHNTINRTNLVMKLNSTDKAQYGVDGFSTLQPQRSIQGDCSIHECTYLRIKVNPCQNESSPIPCQTASTINNVIDNNYLLLTLFTRTKQGDPNELAVQLSLKDALSFRQRFPFNIYTFKFKPNYLVTWFSAVTVTLQLDTPWFAIDRLPRLLTGPDTEYCKLDFLLSGVGVQENKIVTTSLDVIGEIAAFFGAITGVAALVMYSYNERDFYLKNPGWEGFSADFTRMQQEQEAPPVVATGKSYETQETFTDLNRNENARARSNYTPPAADI